MARIAYPDTEADPGLAPLIAQIKAERGGKLLNLYRMLLHSPPLAAGWLHFFTVVRQQLDLPGRDRELAILRVAVLNGADYEFAQHVPFALREGCTAAQIEAVRTDPASSLFGPRERAVLDYTDAMTRDIQVPDAIAAAVRAEFPEREVVELTATIAGYSLVSRFLEAMAIDHE